MRKRDSRRQSRAGRNRYSAGNSSAIVCDGWKLSVWPTHVFAESCLYCSFRMNAEQKASAHKRRTRAEVQQLVADHEQRRMKQVSLGSQVCRHCWITPKLGGQVQGFAERSKIVV